MDIDEIDKQLEVLRKKWKEDKLSLRPIIERQAKALLIAKGMILAKKTKLL